MSFKKIISRIFKGIPVGNIKANLFGQVTTLTMQLASLPIYFSIWTAEQYGEWLIISAIALYFNLADIGVASIAMNRMTMMSANDRKLSSNIVFQNAFGIVTFNVVMLIFLTYFFILTLGNEWLSRYLVELLILILAYLLNSYSSIFDGMFRSANLYYLGTMCLTFARIIEWLMSMIFLYFFKTFLACALGFFLGRFVCFVFLLIYGMRCAPIYNFKKIYLNKKIVFWLLSHGRLFLMFPISSYLLLQGVTISIGLTLGAKELATFNVYRTLSRVIVQGVGAISHSLWPIYSVLYAKKEYARLKESVDYWTKFVTFVGFLVSVGVYILSDEIILHWTKGNIDADNLLMAIMLLVALVSSKNNLYFILSVATNKISKISNVYILVATAASVLVYFLGQEIGIYAVGCGVLLCELVTHIFLVNNSKLIFNEVKAI